MLNWSDTVFRRSNVTRRRISNTYYSRGIEEAKRTHPRFVDWGIFIQKFNHHGDKNITNILLVDETG
jgi:hypothetical protein